MPHFLSDPHMDTFIQKFSDRTNGRFCFKWHHMYAARYCDDFPSNLLASFREQLVISKFRHKTLTTFRQLFRGHTEKRINRQKIDCSEKLPTKISENLTTNPVRRNFRQDADNTFRENTEKINSLESSDMVPT